MKKMILTSILAMVTVLGVGLAASNTSPSVTPNVIFPDY